MKIVVFAVYSFLGTNTAKEETWVQVRFRNLTIIKSKSIVPSGRNFPTKIFCALDFQGTCKMPFPELICAQVIA